MKSYKNANVFYGKNLELVKGKTILVDQGRIQGITDEQFESSIDLHGDYVIPAFVNAHCHLGDTGAKELGVGLTLEEAVVYPNGLKHKYLAKITSEELTEAVRDGLKEMLKNGIILAADYREGGLAGIQAVRQAQKGLPIHVMELGRPALTNADSTEKEFEKEIRSILEVSDGFGMGQIYVVSKERMKKIRSLCGDKIFSIHIAEGRSDCEKSKREYNQSEVERAAELETDFMVHLTHTDDHDKELLVKKKIPIVCCPRTNLILGDGFPELDAFTRLGITWGLGSDNMMFTSPDLFREMDTASRVIRGLGEKPDCMDFRECLKAATWSGAKSLKRDSEFGSIEEGKSASFLAIHSGSWNLKHSHNVISSIVHRVGPEDIDYFLADGTEVIRKGEFLFE